MAGVGKCAGQAERLNVGLQLGMKESRLSQVVCHPDQGNYLFFCRVEPEAVITLTIFKGAMN